MTGAAFQSSTTVWPVPSSTDVTGAHRSTGWSITSGFGWRDDPRAPGTIQFHDGVDLAGPALCHGCPVAAMFDATVAYVGWDVPDAADPDAAAGGQIVKIESGEEDFEVLYAHLEPYRLHVQLQGRIEDRHGRYDDEREYRPVGRGELVPDMADGEISMWCDTMPGFVARRTGPGTVTFSYDRPANCRTTVTWGRRGDDWEGWIPDDPPARDGQAAELSWSTPLDTGRSAGDVALRFRAHLVPPPPPPTATPPVSGTVPLEPSAEPEPAAPSAKARGYRSDDQRSALPRCDALPGGGSRCTWALAAIPEAEPAGALSGDGRGAVGPLAPSHRQDTAPPETPDTATPVPAAPAPDLVVSAPSREQAVGQVFTIVASVFSEADEPNSVAVRAALDPLLELLDASAAGGACTVAGASAECSVRAGERAPATVTITARARPGAPAGTRLTATITAEAEGVTVERTAIIGLSSVVMAPGPWPPPTATPAPPTPTIPGGAGHPEPTAAPAPLPTTAPCMSAVAAALTRQGARYSQGGVLPGDPLGDDGRPLPRTGPHSFDCSGLVWWAYARAGVPVGATTTQQLDDGVRIPCALADLRGEQTRCWAPGDLVFLRYPGGQHVAIYAGRGLFMDCFNHRVGCVLHDISHDPFYQAHFLEARRIVSGCEGMAIDPGLPTTPPLDGGPQGDVAGACLPGLPSFASPVETLAGCGPPLRLGDRVFQLDSVVGHVGVTGSTTGPHLHLGLRARAYDGDYHQANICAPEWLRGRAAPPGASCWTEMADPLDFLPRALGRETTGGGTPVPEGAPYQLPPPGASGALVLTPAPDATPVGQYWSPHADGGSYGGGSAAAWLRGAICAAWKELPGCK
jgi:cell wall-associated NlpC family hydrolase